MTPYLGTRFRLSFAAAQSLAALDAEVTEFSKVLKLYHAVGKYDLKGKLFALHLLKPTGAEGEEIEQHIRIAWARLRAIEAASSSAATPPAAGRSSP
jgi:hypothetical protein